MYRLNWGLALASNGSFQVIDTIISPGVKDDWSETRVESFSFFVAPADYVDSRLGLANIYDYKNRREHFLKYRASYIKDIILQYFDNKKNIPTWSEHYVRPKEREWGDIF